jgi:hypothetical protein
MNELLKLIKENEDAFYNSVVRRFTTSTNNTSKHQAVLVALDTGDYTELKRLFYNINYLVPLEKVVMCMEVEYSVKDNMIQSYDKMKGGL